MKSVDNKSSTSIKNSQVIAIVKTLDKSEIREFRKWLQSPVHNQREDVVQLFEYLVAGNHLYEDKFLEKERIFRKIFGKEAYNDAKLRQTNHFLSKCLEEYLCYKEWQKDEIRNRILLIAQLRKRKLSKNFSRSLNSLENAQREQPFRNDRYLRNEYLIQNEIFNFLQERERSPHNNLQEVSSTLDYTYYSEKLMVVCRMLFHQSVYKTNFDFGPLTEVVNFVETRALLTDPVIAIYYYIYKALTEEDGQTYFGRLRNTLFGQEHIFPDPQLKEIYLMAINYCIRKMNAGVEEFVREAFEWYKQGFENYILIEDKVISRWTYLNVVLIALKLKEFKWAENFIKNFNSLLGEKYRDNFHHYSRARLLFEKKDYDKAMDMLIQFEYDDLLINLNAKTLLVKIYYENDEFDTLESLLESMRIYIRRKEVLGYHKANYQNIIRFTKKLVRINPFDKKEKEKLRESIVQTTPLTEKEWLLEQLN